MNSVIKRLIIKNIVRKTYLIHKFLLSSIVVVAPHSQAATSSALMRNAEYPIVVVPAYENDHLILAKADSRNKNIGRLKMSERDRELTVQWDAESFPMLRILHLSDGGQRQIVTLDARGGEVVVPTNNLPAGGRWEIILINGKNEIHRKIPRRTARRGR